MVGPKRLTAADTFELAVAAYNIQPDSGGIRGITEAQLVATRRAMAKLVKEGRAFSLYRERGVKGGRWLWLSERRGVHHRIQWLQECEGNPFFDDDEVARLAAEKAQLTARAEKLGVDVSKPWPA